MHVVLYVCFVFVLTLRACAGGLLLLCVCVCVCVRVLSHISPLECLFVLKILSRTQQATEVKIFVGYHSVAEI